jgi:hypothetical protein
MPKVNLSISYDALDELVLASLRDTITQLERDLVENEHSSSRTFNSIREKDTKAINKHIKAAKLLVAYYDGDQE